MVLTDDETEEITIDNKNTYNPYMEMAIKR